MTNSNIVAGSNVFLSRTDNPWFDKEFVKQVMDLSLLEKIKKRHSVDNRVPLLSDVQMSIIHRGIRCFLSEDDPCIGYVEGKGVVVKCLKMDCPGIYDRKSFYGRSPWKGCNPSITEEYVKQWTPDPSETGLYDYPKKPNRYYLIDIISDDEMQRYYSPVFSDSVKYPVINEYDEEDEDPGAERNTKIDPKTGRKKVIVGYKYVFIGNDYDTEKLEPIWDFANEVEKKNRVYAWKKAKRIEKKQDSESINEKIDYTNEYKTDSDFVRKAEYEKSVGSHITREVKLTEIDEKSMNTTDTVVLLDNPAELAFVSSAFLVSGIEHGIRSASGVRLATIDDFEKYVQCKHVMISKTVLKSGCKESNVKAWKALAQRNSIEQLNINDREYYEFKYGDKSCWTCKSVYGVTHVCADPEQISDLEDIADGVYPVILAKDVDSYLILETDGNILGHLGKTFVNLIAALEKNGEITGTIAVIEGLAIRVLKENM